MGGQAIVAGRDFGGVASAKGPLCSLARGGGESSLEESVVYPLEFRKEILYFMERAPRRPTAPIDDGTGADDPVIDMIVAVVRRCIGS